MAGRRLDVEFFDQTDFVPLHEGPNVLPHDLIFHTLQDLAMNHNGTAVKDDSKGHAVSHRQLFSDIIRCRNEVRATLDSKTVKMLQSDCEVSICILSEGYEFVVAFFAVLALGGIAVPLSPKITVPEASYFVETARAHGILANPTYLPLANEVAKNLGPMFKVVSSSQHCFSPIIDPRTIVFCASRMQDQRNPALVIFTSGSTGMPKGACYRRYNLYAHSVFIIKKNKIDGGYNNLQFMPTHHGTGLLVNTVPTILGGGCLEIMQGRFDGAKVWERLRKGDIRSFSAVPTMYVRLLDYWDNVISKLPATEREEYQKGISKIRDFHCSTSAIPRHVAERWPKVTGGAQVLERYSGTEFGSVFANYPGVKTTPGSAGVKTPGTESMLSDGDEGEVLVRSPFLVAKYINDLEATRKAFNKDGFFKTGDLARREGDQYYILARTSVDVLKSGGYKISALDIEHELLQHPKIAEAVVVGIDDVEFGQRIAAAVVLKKQAETLTIDELRNDMKNRLSSYKIPTILRVVPELKKTATFKVPKFQIMQEFFKQDHPEIQRWTRTSGKL